MKKVLRAAAVAVAAVVAFMWFGWKFGLPTTTNATVCIRVMERISPNQVEYSISTNKSTYILDKAEFDGVRNSHTYTITYRGWKLPLFGVYPEAEEIKPVVPADEDGVQECHSRRPE